MMNRALHLTALLLLSGACASTSSSPAPPASLFDQAEDASTRPNVTRARDLFREAASTDPDPVQRDRALLRAAFLDWYVFHDAAAARASLDRIGPDSREASAAWSERARMETELTRDFDAAREAAGRARTLARTLADRETAALRSAGATVEQARLARLDGTCPQDTDRLRAAIGELQTAIAEGGPLVESSQLLLDAALMTGDDDTLLQAWRWYYADVPALVPSAIGTRRELGLALSRAKLFVESELVLHDACRGSVPLDDEVREALAYARTVRNVARIAHEHHRATARGTADGGAFRNALGAEAMALWKTFRWTGEAPPFSLETFSAETEKRFGTVTALGEVEGVFNLLMGHKVVDESLAVEQYGHKASLRFVSLDGMTAGGYVAWVTHGNSGTGGWIGDDAIYQIRPMYVDDATVSWRRITDAGTRTRRDEEIARESARDAERAKGKPVSWFRGLRMRLSRQYSEALRDSLAAKGLAGPELRDAFLTRATREKFESSILAHEGRHAIDKKIFRIGNDAELEFRAKISEITFSASPRGAIDSLLSPVGPPGAHGIANERLLRGVEAWMKAHAAEIPGLDPALPMIPQLDRLSDAQIRTAYRSQDPLLK